ncbi:MAG: LysE family transporter [Myxococcaceae bacterium]
MARMVGTKLQIMGIRSSIEVEVPRGLRITIKCWAGSILLEELSGEVQVSLGAQNLFVLESGLKKQRHFFVPGLCSLCDGALIAVGVLGVATILVEIPLLKISLGIFGVLFLAWYAIGVRFSEGILRTN